MKNSERRQMHEDIIKHGKQLLAIFPQATIQEPTILCKKLHAYERKATEMTTKLCNGCPGLEESCEGFIDRTEKAVKKLLGITEEGVMFINRDPRGYALKITEEFSKDKRIYIDWGGYGIIAPDFTPNE